MMADITLKLEANDGDRSDDMVTVGVYSGTSATPKMEDDVEITVADIHMLPTGDKITVTAWDMEEEGAMVPPSLDAGGTVYLEVAVDRGDDGYPADEPLTVTLTSSGPSATLTPAEVEVPAGVGDQKAPRVKLDVATSNAITPGMLRVSASVSGKNDADNGPSTPVMATQPLSLEITQPDAKLITARGQMAVDDAVKAAMATGAGDELNPGESFTLDPNNLFELTAAGMAGGYTLQLSAASSDDTAKVGAGIINDMARIEATAAGNANVTITAGVTMPSSSATILEQALLDEAQIVIPISVMDPPADPMAPSMPMGLTAKVSDGQVTLSWEKPTSGEAPTGYQFRSAADGRWSDWAATSSMTGHVVIGLTNGTEYTFEVRAVAGALEGAAASVTATPMGVPGPPQELAAVEVDGQVTLTWAAPATGGDAASYEYRVTAAGVSGEWMPVVPPAMNVTVSNLTNGTEYTFEVRGVNSVGNGEAASITATPRAPRTRAKRGQITEFKLVGDDTSEKTIGGIKRVHVPEGAQGVALSVTVQWTHEEIRAIGYEEDQWIYVEIRDDRGATGSSDAAEGNWLSWIDSDADVHFPQRNTRGSNSGGSRGGWVTVKTPKATAIPVAQRGSARHVKSATGTLPVLVLHDNHEAENDAFYIEAEDNPWVDVDLDATAAVNKISPHVVIEDDEEQSVTVEGTKTSATVYEGASGDNVPTFTVAADPQRFDLPLEVRLDMVDLGGATVSSAEISLDKSSMTLTRRSNSDEVTVHLPANDGNRTDDNYKLETSVVVYSLASGGYETVPAESHAITVLDVHKLPELMVTQAADTVEEGGEVELTLTLNRNPKNTIATGPETRQYTEEAVDIMLTAGAGTTAGTADYQLPMTVEFGEHNKRAPWTQEMKVMVKALADDEIEGGEMLAIDAMVSGKKTERGDEKDSHPGVSMLTIEDATGKLVWAKTQQEVEAAVYDAKNTGMGDDMTFTAGEMIEVLGGLLFDSAEGVSVSYSAGTSDAGVASTSVSGGMVTVTAIGAGMADITITAHASRPSGVKILDQTDPGEASIMFPVEVGLEALSITLSGPDEMNLVEGGVGAMVMATANRAVTEEVTVTLMRDRSMSTAGDTDYEAAPITIAAGTMAGSTMVMALEDNMSEPGEELVLYGMTEGMAGEVTGEVHLYLWDAAVPALPVIAQLLLAAFLAVGGYRRYRRR